MYDRIVRLNDNSSIKFERKQKTRDLLNMPNRKLGLRTPQRGGEGGGGGKKQYFSQHTPRMAGSSGT